MQPTNLLQVIKNCQETYKGRLLDVSKIRFPLVRPDDKSIIHMPKPDLRFMESEGKNLQNRLNTFSK